MNKNPVFFRCSLCGRFISYKDMETAVHWTTYGGCMDLEPPDPEFAHLSCWNNASDSQRKTISAIAWQGDDNVRTEGPPIGARV